MGFSIFSNGDKISYNIKNYVADTINDLTNIPKSASGSMVFIIENSKYYILNNKQEWIEIETASGSGGIVPTEYIMPDEYAIGGSICDGTATGYYIKRGTTEIKQAMFQPVTNLESVDIPDSVTKIEVGAFAYLTKLGSIRLPENLVSVGNSAFTQCSKLNFDEFPDTLEQLGTYSFYNCTKLTTNKLPINVNVIPNNCFAASGITIDEIPENVSTIDTYAFFNCQGITSIQFKGTPSTIAANAFENCTNLLNIYVPWSENAVANAPWGATNATITYNYTGE